MAAVEEVTTGSTGGSLNESRKYQMNRNPRGKALIFVHTDYHPDLDLQRRRETNIDVKRLHKCFSKLGFTIKTYTNLMFDTLDKILKDASQEDHSDRDCLVVIVLTHGLEGELYAQDRGYRYEQLWSHFSATRCHKTLIGKPKLFFIQACRGCKEDSGVELTTEKLPSKVFCEPIEDTLGLDLNLLDLDNKQEPTFLIDVEDDFFVAFATVHGCVSWKNRGTKSWFIEKLCEELLKEENSTLHLLLIMTIVHWRVAIECSSNPNGCKQTPCVTHRLKKLLYF